MVQYGAVVKSGSILVLVAGLSALLLSLAVAVITSTRAMDGASAKVISDAQTRVALIAALNHLQETSRLGWGGTGADSRLLHAYGWTDVRDGEAGPRGPHGLAPSPHLRLGWTPGGAYPAPGSVFRGDMFSWRTPPYAMRQTIRPNPYNLLPEDTLRDAWEPVIGLPLNNLAGNDGREQWAKLYGDRALDAARAVGNRGRASQPIADTWAEFEAGDKRPDPMSIGRVWFRIYRETVDDRNGDNDPWYDRVPIAGHGTFIITVGSGSTRGFRFWNTTTDYLNGRLALPGDVVGYSPVLEPVTAMNSGLFFSEESFRNARSSETIAWYRVMWSADTSAGYEARDMLGLANDSTVRNAYQGILTRLNANTDNNALPFGGGHFKFIQRLEKEPPKW